MPCYHAEREQDRSLLRFDMALKADAVEDWKIQKFAKKPVKQYFHFFGLNSYEQRSIKSV